MVRMVPQVPLRTTVRAARIAQNIHRTELILMFEKNMDLVYYFVARGGGRGIANLFFTQLCWRLTQLTLLCYSDGYYL